MSDRITIQPVSRPIDAEVHIPGSKSITNRALILAALASGRSSLRGALFSDDTRYMSAALNDLGIPVVADEGACSFEVEGKGGSTPAGHADLFVGNSGTSVRFLTALCALGRGTYRLDGVPRMRERPIRDLLDALNGLGVSARDELGTGCPPVVVSGNRLPGGKTSIRGDISSQYLSALLHVAPLAAADVEIAVEGELVSQPYVEMTLRIMEQWGVMAANEEFRAIRVPAHQSYHAQNYSIEPDASSASYFFAAAALTGGRVRVMGLGRGSLQGDLEFVRILERMGCEIARTESSTEVRGPVRLRGVDIDMNRISDTVMTLAAIAPFADSPTTIRNVANIRHKETDRIAAVVHELRRLGVEVEERPDGLSIQPAARILPAEIETYDDHRMAMSFAVAGLRAPGITILNPGCVSKTFPGFYASLADACSESKG